jgi:hypothetical protein
MQARRMAERLALKAGYAPPAPAYEVYSAVAGGGGGGASPGSSPSQLRAAPLPLAQINEHS